MRKVLHKLAVCIAAILITLIVSVAGALLAARYQAASFERLAARAALLRPGHSTSFAEELVRSYGSQGMTDGTRCDSSKCTFAITLTNFLLRKNGEPRWFNHALLRRIGLRPAGALAIVIADGGKIQGVMFEGLYQNTSGLWEIAQWQSLSVLPSYSKCEADAVGHPSFAVQAGATGSPVYGRFVSAHLVSETGNAEHDELRTVDFGCMTRVSDCTNISSGAQPLMPNVQLQLLKDKAWKKDKRQEHSAFMQSCVDQTTLSR